MTKFPPVFKGDYAIIHGGDYNPEQWLKEKDTIWKRDMELAKGASINSLSVGIFSWALIEREEGVFDFSWLDETMDMLAENDIKAILATPSGARPPWLAEKYPEVLRVDNNRQKMLYAGRHNHCLSSPVYREKVRIINTKLAERYKNHPALAMWHVSNEYGGECHCEICQKRFREWLRERYLTIDKLNDAWWGAFWSHVYTSFEQISSPTTPSWLGENEQHGLKLAWRRFVSDQHCNFVDNEIAPLRAITPDIPVTINMMDLFPTINYFEMAKRLDRASWDNYPQWTGSEADYSVALRPAFNHELQRSLKDGKPFLMMESSPSVVNWQSSNSLREPGTVMLQGLQAVAFGSDSVQYFQFRKGRGGCEKFHGAIVDHEGSENTRVYKEVAETGRALQKLSEVAGTGIKADTALLFDWENNWALSDAKFGKQDKRYEETVMRSYEALKRLGVQVDIVDETKSLDKYKVVIGDMAYMLRGDYAARVKRFVENGGTYIGTYVTGYVNDEDLCFLGGFPGPLSEMFGIWAEEIDILPQGAECFIDYHGKDYKTLDWCEVIHAKGADVIGKYADASTRFYRDTPALTMNRYGEGTAYYIAARMPVEFLIDFYRDALVIAGVETEDMPEGVMRSVRSNGENEYLFLMNFYPKDSEIELHGDYTDLLTGKHEAGKTTLKSRQAMCLKKN